MKFLLILVLNQGRRADGSENPASVSVWVRFTQRPELTNAFVSFALKHVTWVLLKVV